MAGIFLLVGIGLCLSSCQLADALTETSENPSAEKNSYEAKILYYETQLKSMTAQLGNMEQQMHLLRSDYLEQLGQLEQLINQYQQNKPETPPEDVTKPSDKPIENPPKEDNPTSTQPETTLSDFTYRLENGKAILTAYLGDDKDVIIPAAVDGYLVVGLGDNVFSESDVVSVVLPQTVETVGWFSFYQCKNLKKIVLPSKISNIGYASFDGCPSTLCLYVTEGSYAEQYAISFGLNYQNKT